MSISALPGPEPSVPELFPIQAIHRHRDGVVTFHRKGEEPESFVNLFGIRSETLQSEFPTIREQLERDSFFSINAYWHRDNKSTFLPPVESRQPDRLRFLCAVYTDLDIYRVGLDFGTALGTVLRYQEENTIPPASVIVRSGRGMWLLWFLHDPKCPDRPPRAFPEKLQLYSRVNRAISERLVDLGPDMGARDAIRIMRVPGSIHHLATHSRVKYWIQADETGKPFSYTLDEMASLCQLTSSRLVPAEQLAMREAERPTGAGARGFAKLNARRRREFIQLRTLRGGFDEGCRNRAVLIYAWLLRCSREPRETILREAMVLASECRPPLSSAEARNAVKTATKRGFSKMMDQTISDWLDITPDESSYLEKLPAATRFGCQRDAATLKQSRQIQRQTAVSEIVRDLGRTPSLREMVRLLRGRQIDVSHTQVRRDYQSLRIEAGT